MDKQLEKNIQSLFYKWATINAESIVELPSSGSYRSYFRMKSSNKTAIAAYNKDVKENTAFIVFTNHFHKEGLPVPQIYSTDEANHLYLLEDLGDTTLFSWMEKNRNTPAFSEEMLALYKKVIDYLPYFQIKASTNIDYSVCYPRAQFDKQSMLWDLSYFKYYFLKLAKINFDEQKLEDDFQTFSSFLLQTKHTYFLYRDFQSRNIMIKDGKPYFIDYQGGRKGALQYDIASLLYDAKAVIPQQTRTILLEYYLDVLSKHITVNKKEFTEFYYGYVMIRIMQALGAYGFRGFYEKKEHFLQSIPYALDNLKWLLQNINLPIQIPTLLNVLNELTQCDHLKKLGKTKSKLHVTINSFSYKKGIPIDNSGNGGGFVFDCRSLHNPGRYEEYALLTGNDEKVIDFLKKEPEIYEFMNHVYGLVNKSIENYIKRDFTHLQINFGCTGGQHRSVFCANLLAAYLKQKSTVDVHLFHTVLKEKNASSL